MLGLSTLLRFYLRAAWKQKFRQSERKRKCISLQNFYRAAFKLPIV